MKNIILIFCAIFFVNIYVNANPLATRVSISESNKSIDAILDIISKQTNYVFSYNPVQLNTLTTKSVKAVNKSIEEVLVELFDGKVSYKLRGKFIILSLKPSKLMADNREVDNLKLNIKQKNTLKQRDSLVIPDRLVNLEPCNGGKDDSTCHSIITNNTEEMKTKLALLLLAFAANQTFAQDVPVPKVEKSQDRLEIERFINENLIYEAAQVAFISPLGTGGTGSIDRAYAFSINMIGGLTGGNTRVEFGGFYNFNKYKTEGAQFAGLFNRTAGIANGVQFAGLANSARFGDTKAQVSGLVNKAENATVQVAGLVNKVDSKSMIQVSGLVNIADSVSTQVAGLVNIAHKAKVQIGLVNIRDTADGVMVGLVNIAKKGGLFEIEASAGEFIQTAASLRTGTDKLYAVLLFGASFKDDLLVYGVGLGTSFQVGSKWKLNIEGMNYQLLDNKFKGGSSINSLTQLRPTISYGFGDHLRVFAGPTANVLQFDSKDNNLSYRTPSLVYSHYGENTSVEGWIGFTAGLRYRF